MRTAALFATTLLVGLLAGSLAMAGPVSAQVGIACDQYGCAEEGPGSGDLAPTLSPGGGVEGAGAHAPETVDVGMPDPSEAASGLEPWGPASYPEGASARADAAPADAAPAAYGSAVAEPSFVPGEPTGVAPLRRPSRTAVPEALRGGYGGEEPRAALAGSSQDGAVRYFDPPRRSYSGAGWEGHTRDQCFFDERGRWVEPPEGELDVHCGLEDLPEAWECEVYYGTAYGTVRGCLERSAPRGGDGSCTRPLHLYDEAGREIDAVPPCPEIRIEACGDRRCGAPAPSDWTCRREHWDFGKLYGGETREIRRCVSPEFYEYVNGERPPCEKGEAAYIGAIYDESGERVDGMTCRPGGTGGDLGEWAGLEAEKADDALGETRRREAVTGAPGGTKPSEPEDRSGGSGAPFAPTPAEHGAEASPWKLVPVASSVERAARVALDRGEPDHGEPDHGEPDRGTAAPVVLSYDQIPPPVEFGNRAARGDPWAERHVAQNGVGGEELIEAGVRLRREGSPAARGATAAMERSGVQDATGEGSRGPRGRVESAGGSRERRAAGPAGSLPGGAEGAGAGSRTASISGGAWLQRLVPLAGLATVGGIFLLRRRYFA